jgi:hypothetical protein
LKPAHIADAPVSAAITLANASLRASRACAAFISSARRSPGPSADHAGNAAAAASAAATASATVAAGARVATSPSSGLRRSKVAPLLACTAAPAISMEILCIVLSPAENCMNAGAGLA